MTQKQTDLKKRNWPTKLLALVCAIMLWFYASAEPMKDMQFDVPVQYINQADGYVVNPPNQTVRVTVKGSEVELSGLRGDDFTAIVDLSNAEIGTGSYKIELESSAAIDRISYQPMKTTLEIDKLATKEVPVRVRTTGTAPEGVHLSSTAVELDNVVIAGLSSQLADITDVETEPIDISNFTGNTVVDAKLNLPEGITVEGEQTVPVFFVVAIDELGLNISIEPRNVAEGLHVELGYTSSDVKLGGDTDLLYDEEETGKVKLYVDCSGLEAGQHVLPVKYEYNGPLTVKSIQHETVTVTLTAADTPDAPGQDDTQTDNNADSSESGNESIMEQLSKKLKYQN